MPIPLLEARDLKKHFPVTKGLLLARTTGSIKAVDGIDFQVWPGQTVSLVGESGCGKTTTARTILRLEKPTSGSLTFEGQEISRQKGDDLRRFRASVQAVFQDPADPHQAKFHCTISAGVAAFSDGDGDFSSWVRAADAALYKAKESGRNSCISFMRDKPSETIEN